jgi:tRNA (guanine37-N1)-methyltransferase
VSDRAAFGVGLVSLFPEFFVGPLSLSIPGRAEAAGAARWSYFNPRDFSTGRHRTVDDAPYGGGAGMVMRPTELGAAVEAARAAMPGATVILMTPQGRPVSQQLVSELAGGAGMILVCGRYEGVDERFVERHVDLEVCVGEAVLSGGEPAALCLLDAVVRLLPGVLGNASSLDQESFGSDRLEYPQFTRPVTFDGLGVPEVLSGGDHAAVARWRQKAGLLRTIARRPDLLARTPLSAAEQKLLDDSRVEVEAWLFAARHRLAGDEPT